jgi:hypothetical protein
MVFPHAAVRVNKDAWLGFKPRLTKCPLSPGFVDQSNLMSNVKHSVTFTIDDAKIARSITPIVSTYQTSWYRGGVHDCVSFVADLAEALGLRIPRRPNLLPDHFVIGLAALNNKACT